MSGFIDSTWGVLPFLESEWRAGWEEGVRAGMTLWNEKILY